MLLTCECRNRWRVYRQKGNAEAFKCPLCGRLGHRPTKSELETIRFEEHAEPIGVTPFGVAYRNADNSGGKVRRANIHNQ